MTRTLAFGDMELIIRVNPRIMGVGLVWYWRRRARSITVYLAVLSVQVGWWH